jgi:hypothetical protein
MRVRCLKIVSLVDNSELTESGWVRVGGEYGEYIVLAFLIQANGRMKVQVLDEDGSPGYWAGEMFETIDETMPPNWVGRLNSAGLLEFGPRDRLRKGFWADYHDDVPEALEQYEREFSIVIK